MDILSSLWLGRWLKVEESDDPTLLGASGQIWNETKKTITIKEGDSQRMLPKRVIKFSIDGSQLIDGQSMQQRTEARIKKFSRRRSK